MRLPTKLLIGLIAGAATGLLAKAIGATWLLQTISYLEPLGIAFIRLITMVVVPLVVGSLLVATASLGNIRKLVGIGGRTLTYFLVTTLIAAIIGLLLAIIIEPGVGISPETQVALSGESTPAGAGAPGGESPPPLSQRLVELIPRNPVEAAARMELLPLIFSVLVFGAAIGVISAKRRLALVTFFEGVNEMVTVVIQWVMKLAPYAVYVLIAATITRFGIEMIQRLVVYSLVIAAGMLIHNFGVLSLSLRFLARTRITAFYRGVAEACLVAFTTTSSNAALPVSMKVAVENLGISKQVVSFVLPLGATLNMNGSALYKSVTAVFIAQVYGFHLGMEQYLTIVVASTLAAVAGVGIPSSSLVTTMIVLNAMGLGPQAAAGLAIVAGLDRILDMLRTTVNVTGDLTCAAYINHFVEHKPGIDPADTPAL